LRSLDVDLVQGFLLARPLEPAALEAHVSRLARRSAVSL
jgi:EAL domain-containing protein (putative c-di-GMP-specific phosphodiesterase class I)